MVAGQGIRVDFNACFSGDFFLFKIDGDGTCFCFCQREPAVGGDHQVMGANDLGVDDEFGFEVAGVVVDGGVVCAGRWDGNPSAHIPGLDDEYGVGGVDGGPVVKNDGVRDAFGDYFVGGEGVLRRVGFCPGVGGSRAKERVEQDGEG